MRDRARHLGQALAIAAAAAMVTTALTGSIAAAASPTACKVRNTDKGIGRDTLQRAVWSADPGDTLIVQGTCVGTTVIKKDLTIGWTKISSSPLLRDPDKTVSSGPPTLRSGSWRPTLIVDPSVDELTILPGLSIRQGFVIGEPRDWRGATRATAPAYWTRWGKARPALSRRPARTVDACAVWNPATERRTRKLTTAVDAADAGDRLVLAGKCWGRTSIERRVYVHGSRVPGDHGCRESGNGTSICIDYVDHGPPILKGQLDISADVDQLAFKRLTLKGGIRIQ